MLEDPNRLVLLQHREQMDKISGLESNLLAALQQIVEFLAGKITKTEVINQVESVRTPDVGAVLSALKLLDERIAQKDVDLSPIQQGLAELIAELRQVPKTLPVIPEQKGEVKVSNLAEINKKFDSLEKAIKGLKLTAEAPKVDVKVPQTKVNVEKPDLKPLQTTLLRVITAIRDIKIPEPEKTDVSGVEKRLDGLGEWFGVVEKHQKTHTKKLQELVDKPIAMGGGGGGGAHPFETSTGASTRVTLTADGKIPVDAEFSGSIEGAAAFSDSGGTDKQGLVDADRHVQTDVLSSALPTGAATAANQTTGNSSLSTIATNTGNALTDTQLRASAVPVSLASVPSHAVTNAGTFAVQATQAGSWTVDTGLTQPTTPSDTQPVSNAGLTELAAAINSSKVDVNIASGNISGFSTSAKQDDLLIEMRIMNGSMAMRVDDTTGTIYQGWAEPGTATSAGSWRIRKIVSSGTPEDTTITWADGNRSFDNVFDDRATLTYS